MCRKAWEFESPLPQFTEYLLPLDSMMIERFTGKDGRYYSIEALGNQSALVGEAGLIEAVYDGSIIHGYSAGEKIIEDSAPNNDIHFILSGVASIRVHDREVAFRSDGQHVGEMAMLDPGQPRSASVVADGEVVTARLDAVSFSRIAEFYPVLWKNIARELASRLRERNRYVRTMNPRPVLFVGCTTESLEIGRAMKSALDLDPVIVKLWTDGIFNPSMFPVESLERMLHSVDFAALVLSPDDTVISRSTESYAPRDNLIFELGLFMGALGRARTILVCPGGIEIKIPTDLMGITTLRYKPESEIDPDISVAAACGEMRNIILGAGPR